MKLKFFSQTTLEELKKRIPDNIDAYDKGELGDVLAGLPGGSVCESRLVAQGDAPKLDPDNDAKSAISLYKWLAKLDRVQASDPRLWTWLCHDRYPQYTAKRWDISAAENPENSVLSRFFIKGISLESFSRNALARLWWGAHQTVNHEDSSDPFKLTKLLFKSQQLHQGLMERTIGRSEHILNAALRKWEKWTADNGQPEKMDDIIKDWTKKLTVAGSVMLLDACDEQHLEDVTGHNLKLSVEKYYKQASSQLPDLS